MHPGINLLNVVNADGVVMKYQGILSTQGVTPEERHLPGLVKWVIENKRLVVYHTSALHSDYTPAEAFMRTGSGILMFMISHDPEEYIIWFRPEMLRELRWAGNPAKPVETDPTNLGNISPRHSFKTWIEYVAGRSEDWSIGEIDSVMRLREEIMHTLNEKKYLTPGS